MSDISSLTPLRFFLQSSMLSTDTEAQDDAAQVPKVTISTVHAAKGLEWPVVFIPAGECWGDCATVCSPLSSRVRDLPILSLH